MVRNNRLEVQGKGEEVCMQGHRLTAYEGFCRD